MHRMTHELRVLLGTALVFGTCLSSPVFAQRCVEVEGRWPYGPAQAVTTDGGLVYFGSGTVLEITQVPVSGTPQLVGEVVLPGLVKGIDVSGTHAFVAGYSSGLRIVDVGSPAEPVEVGALESPRLRWAHDVKISGGYAYVADERWGLRIIDVSSPTTPVEVGSHDTSGVCGGVAVSGSYVYLADGTFGLRVIDASTPTAPVEVGFLDTPSQAKRVFVAGDHAYLATLQAGLRIIDVSTPTAPVEVAVVPVQWTTSPFVAGGLAYLTIGTSYSGSFSIYDVSTPSAPLYLGGSATPGSALMISVSGDRAFVADYHGGLRVIDVRSATAPVEVGSYDTPGVAVGAVVSDGFAHVLEDDRGLRVIDVQTPGVPIGMGFLGLTIDTGLAVQGDFAYVPYRQRMHVVDVSTPSSPVEVGSCALDGQDSVAVSGDYAFVVGHADPFDFRVIDVSVPTGPLGAGRCALPGYAHGVAVSGAHAYVATDTFVPHPGPSYSSLRVVDVSTPSAPVEVGSADHLTYGARDVDLAGDHAFVASYLEGLWVVDVSTPTAPVEVGAVDTPGTSWRVAVSDGIAYVADGPQGLRVIDVADPTAPVEIYHHSTIGDAEDVALFDGHVFVAAGEAGGVVFRFCDLFHDGFESGTTAAWIAWPEGLP